MFEAKREEDMSKKEDEKTQDRRKFLKTSIATVSGIAALPLLSSGQKFTTKTKIADLSHLKTAKLSPKTKNLTVADLRTLQEIAIGSLKGADTRFTTIKNRYARAEDFKGVNIDELTDLAQAGFDSQWGVGSASCGSCASCCCCCCPCCCCT